MTVVVEVSVYCEMTVSSVSRSDEKALIGGYVPPQSVPGIS